MSYDGDRESNLYEELSKFVAVMRDRLEREREQADALDSQAKFARRQADETTRVYETLAKLHESMANKPADALDSQAKFARRQADETTRVYETLAKLHESMANKPADAPPTFGYTVTANQKEYRVT